MRANDLEVGGLSVLCRHGLFLNLPGSLQPVRGQQRLGVLALTQRAVLRSDLAGTKNGTAERASVFRAIIH